jgi:hypothetical protein
MNEKDTVIEETTVRQTAETVKKIYIGPSIPRTNLCYARILEGTEEQIAAFLTEYEEKYPEVKFLLATPDNLSSMINKSQTKGNILHKYYQDMAAKAVVERKEG